MKTTRILLFSCFILLMSINAVAQQQIISIEQNNGRLAIMQPDNTKKPVLLTKEQLQNLLSSSQYSSYKTAHNCYVASIPLLTLSGCYVAISTVSVIVGIYADASWQYDPEKPTMSASFIFYTLAGITLGGSLLHF
ncbi:MAG: hypothetical protein LBS55_05115, partial [Prevotellaceae bacterium]|nr:hypothetical protein [Prevotellaceae bacterium]